MGSRIIKKLGLNLKNYVCKLYLYKQIINKILSEITSFELSVN